MKKYERVPGAVSRCHDVTSDSNQTPGLTRHRHTAIIPSQNLTEGHTYRFHLDKFVLNQRYLGNIRK